MAAGERIEDLLADLQTITNTARSGVISKHDEVLEPGETRPAAILFVDIVGFTELANKISSELLTKVIDRTFRIFELTVRAHGGYCDKVIGDAALYVFAGHPNYPPVCEAALTAALKLSERMVQVNASLEDTGVAIAIRQGVSFGEVTRQAVGAQQAQLTVMGATVNAAQRLQATAQPGTIQTTIRVLEKAGDLFLFKKLGQLELKGIGEVTTYRVTGAERPHLQLRGAFRRLTPLIGRDDTMREAQQQVAQWLAIRYPPETWDITQVAAPRTDRNRLLLVRGMPAVGKSRFAYELAEHIKLEYGAVYATAHCVEHTSLATFTAELAAVAGLEAETLPQRWAELCANAALAVSPQYAESQLQHLRLLAYVLGCQTVDASVIDQTDAKSFDISCQLALRACCELTAHEAAGGAGFQPVNNVDRQDACPTKPVILVVEDLQWMGRLQVVIADILARTCLPTPLIVIATARPEYAPSAVELYELAGTASASVQIMAYASGASASAGNLDGDWGENEAQPSPYRIIELGALSRTQGEAVIQALLPGLELTQHIADELHEKAEGIPYFYEDFARMLVRRRLVVEEAGTYRMLSDIDALDIPEDIEALMLGRLDQIDTELRELTRRASVLGASFERSLLAVIEQRLGYDHAGHFDDDLAALLSEKLLAHGEGDRYFFEHLLLREAAYASLLKVNRRLLHDIAANVLECMITPGAVSEAQLLPKLVEHLKAAGRHAEEHTASCQILLELAQSGRMETWDYWEQRARSSLEQATGQAPGAPQISYALCLAQAVLKLRQGEYEASATLYDTAHKLAEAANDALAQTRALVGQGILGRITGNPVLARSCFESALELALASGDKATQGLVLNNIGLLEYYQGGREQAVKCYNQSLALARAAGNLHSEANTLVYLGTLMLDLGHSDKAYECHLQAHQIALSLNDRILEGVALGNIGAALNSAGRLEEAVHYYQQALKLNRLLGQRSGMAYNLHNLGELALVQQDLKTALANYADTLAIFRMLADTTQICETLAALGKVHALLGQINESLNVLTEAQALCNDLSNKLDHAVVACSWVYYYAAAGQLPQAKQALAAAEALAQERGTEAGSPLAIELGSARAALKTKLHGRA